MRTLQTEVETYVADLVMMNPNKFVLFRGDLNTRLDPNDYTSIQTKIPPLPFLKMTDSSLPIVQKTKKSSVAGLWLKHILNSILESDHPTKFTYLSDSRISAIDYIIVSRDLLL